jgi:hypothetical protein
MSVFVFVTHSQMTPTARLLVVLAVISACTVGSVGFFLWLCHALKLIEIVYIAGVALPLWCLATIYDAWSKRDPPLSVQWPHTTPPPDGFSEQGETGAMNLGPHGVYYMPKGYNRMEWRADEVWVGCTDALVAHRYRDVIERRNREILGLDD